MPVKVSDYSASTYSDILKGIGFVWKHLRIRGGEKMVNDQLGPIFLKHGVEKRFGLAVLHRHFDLAPNECLVEVNGVSIPWDVARARGLEGGIAPTSWLFSADQLIPYEFKFIDRISTKEHQEDPTAFPEFLDELVTALKKNRVQRYLALTVHPAPDFRGSVEFTVGRANISLAPERITEMHTLDASFFFDPEYEAKQAKEKCEYGHCDAPLQQSDLDKMEAVD